MIMLMFHEIREDQHDSDLEAQGGYAGQFYLTLEFKGGPGGCIHMNVHAQKTHVSIPTWNYCIQRKGVESTLTK